MHKKDNLIFFCTYYICESIIREYNKLKNSIPDEFDVVLVINNEETKLNYEYGIHNIEFYIAIIVEALVPCFFI